jgi:hypothetical protein
MRQVEATDRELIHAASNAGRSVPDRVQAAKALAARDSDEVVDALLRLSKDPSTPDAVGEAVGRSLGAICFRRAEDIDELDMAMMTEAADRAYDEEIGRLQRLDPMVTMRRHRRTRA